MGSGAPLLLVHSVNAAGVGGRGAAALRALRDAGARSSRSTCRASASVRAQRPRLHAAADDRRAARDARRRSAQRCGAGAAGRAGAVAGLRVPRPRRGRARRRDWGRLALVSPTGFSGAQAAPRRAGQHASAMPWLHAVLRGAGCGRRRCSGGLTRPGVDPLLPASAPGAGRQIDEQPGRYAVADHARARRASTRRWPSCRRKLFSADIHATSTSSCAQPVWMSHGVRGDFTDYRGKDGRRTARPNWRFNVFPTGALPYFERADRSSSPRCDRFLGAAAAGLSAASGTEVPDARTRPRLLRAPSSRA
ncbi:MAG: alpha/beta hydrolase [Comamonadaceae bacterium]|nr:alpha/beta hydrolase [Comamonadaceae bacterium]